MNKLLLTAAGAALLAMSSSVSFADSVKDEGIPGELTANVALTSDYRFRGISQTDGDPAIQGGIDYFYGIFYAGLWGSSLEFPGVDASTEIDLYAGITPTLGPINLDFGVIYYAYPGADDDGAEFDYWELKAKAGHDFGPLAVYGSVNYSPEFFGETGDAFYYEGSVSVPLPAGFSASGAYGYQDIDEVGGVDFSYSTWNIGLSYSFDILTLDARYVDTDADSDECFGGIGSDLCEDTVVFTLKAAM